MIGAWVIDVGQGEYGDNAIVAVFVATVGLVKAGGVSVTGRDKESRYALYRT